ncbi:MAG TPA: CZB domain-containing protein [Gammaproteobacteria bacterium]
MSDNSTKEELLSLIRRAKSSHIRWRAYAQGLVSGVPVAEDRLPVKHTDCKFGQWYYGDGARQLGHLDIFRDVEAPHEMLHAVYGQIHELVVQQGDNHGAHRKLDELIAISRTLLEQIEILEQEVNVLPD